MPSDIVVRPANPGNLPAVMNILDGGALETDISVVRDAIETGQVLVAIADDAGSHSRHLGAVVLNEQEVHAIAVRPRRRNQGIGTALVEAAQQREGRLVAEFDTALLEFWRSCGFEIEEFGNGRFRGTWETD